MTAVPAAAVVGDSLDTAAGLPAGTPFVDWVCRPDCHGRNGWGAADLAESDRWRARCDFDDLPVVPGRLAKSCQRKSVLD